MNKVDIVTSERKNDNAKPVVVVDGKAYPCDLTMGAFLRYKREVGEEATEIKERELCKLITLMWCCAKSACSRDKVGFDMSLEEFSDNINPQDVADWSSVAIYDKANDEVNEEDEEKKA